ncbi:efflux RND transporter periplasmic adaptor subunit [Candidatus Methylacidiphilum infernorum]|nr:efflux RND transporter periplasmic adaptor subunit [Candidatus Methylacidiphilum infernorum]
MRERTEQELLALVLVSTRKDLVGKLQLFAGKEFYVVKDPLSLNYFRFPPEEYDLAQLIDGKRRIGEILLLFHRKYPHLQITAEEVISFHKDLIQKGLVILPARSFVSEVTKKRPFSLFGLWAQLIHNLIFFKIPLLDPNDKIEKVVQLFSFVWSKTGITLTVAFWMITVFFLFINEEAFKTNEVNFFSPQNFFLLYLATGLVKTFHEFGHALSCKRFGGEVHEMGIGFLCFVPVGYVDASDTWMIEDKRKRLFVAAAGIYMELTIAALASYFWVFSPLGLAKNLAFNVMVTASVTTLLFNLNPLMRFDGYYALCDLLEIPNLREKAIAFCSAKVQRLLFGYRNLMQEELFQDESKGKVFILYAIAAYLYMVYLIYAVGGVLFARVLKPYGLENVGFLFGIFFEASFALLLVSRVLYDAFSTHNKAYIVKIENVWIRLSKVTAFLCLLLSFLFFVPVREKISVQAVARAEKGQSLSSPSGGVVEEVYVRNGQWVKAGEPLLKLKNPEIETEERWERLELASLMLDLSPQHGSREVKEKEKGAIASLSLNRTISRLRWVEKLKEGLLIRANAEGMVTTPDPQALVGKYCKAHEVILNIAETKTLYLWIPLDESQTKVVAVGNKIKAAWLATAEYFYTTIDKITKGDCHTEDLLPALFVRNGGPVPSVDFGNPSAVLKKFPVFFALAPVPPLKGELFIEGMRAKVRIYGKKTTIGKRLWNKLCLFFLKKQEG